MPPTTRLAAVAGNGGGGFRFAALLPHLPPWLRLDAPTAPGFDGRPLSDLGVAQPRVADLADWLARDVADRATPGERLVWLGHGVGGSLVLDALQRHCDGVAGMVLHAPVGVRLDERRLPRLMSLPGATATARALLGSPLARPLWQRGLGPSVPAPVVDHVVRGYRGCEAFGLLFEQVDAAWFASLRPLDVPTTLVWGTRERVLSPDHVGDWLQLLPHAHVERVAGWGHWPMLTEPAAYARVMADVVARLVA